MGGRGSPVSVGRVGTPVGGQDYPFHPQSPPYLTYRTTPFRYSRGPTYCGYRTTPSTHSPRPTYTVQVGRAGTVCTLR